jgi:hypothetical protein
MRVEQAAVDPVPPVPRAPGVEHEVAEQALEEATRSSRGLREAGLCLVRSLGGPRTHRLQLELEIPWTSRWRVLTLVRHDAVDPQLVRRRRAPVRGRRLRHAQEVLVRDLGAGTYYIGVHAFSSSVTTGTVSLRWQT